MTGEGDYSPSPLRGVHPNAIFSPVKDLSPPHHPIMGGPLRFSPGDESFGEGFHDEFGTPTTVPSSPTRASKLAARISRKSLRESATAALTAAAAAVVADINSPILPTLAQLHEEPYRHLHGALSPIRGTTFFDENDPVDPSTMPPPVPVNPTTSQSRPKSYPLSKGGTKYSSNGELLSLALTEGIDLQVSDYYYVLPTIPSSGMTNGGSSPVPNSVSDSYDRHFFVVSITVEDTKYSVDRSYVDFVELHRRLSKILPTNELPPIPLRAYDDLEKILNKDTSSAAAVVSGVVPGNAAVGGSTRESILGGGTRQRAGSVLGTTGVGSSAVTARSFRIPANSTEAMPSLKAPLTSYLVNLAMQHEILASDILAWFLDEERPNMFVSQVPPVLSTYDLLLLTSKVHITTVNRTEERLFDVPANHFLVWRFETIRHDIGFAVDVGGHPRLRLTRYRSNDAPVCGAVEITSTTRVALRWDNTYAKFHSKELHWSVRIVSATEWYGAKEEATVCFCEKKRFDLQRKALRRASLRHAAKLGGITYGSLIEEEYAESEALSFRAAQDAHLSMVSKHDFLSLAVHRAETRIKELEALRKSMEERLTAMTESWQYATTQAEQSRPIIEALTVAVAELEGMVPKGSSYQSDVANSVQVLGCSQVEQLRFVREYLGNVAEDLTDALSQCEQEHLAGQRKLEDRQKSVKMLLQRPNSMDMGAQAGEALELAIGLVSDLGDVMGVVERHGVLMTELKDVVRHACSAISSI